MCQSVTQPVSEDNACHSLVQGCFNVAVCSDARDVRPCGSLGGINRFNVFLLSQRRERKEKAGDMHRWLWEIKRDEGRGMKEREGKAGDWAAVVMGPGEMKGEEENSAKMRGCTTVHYMENNTIKHSTAQCNAAQYSVQKHRIAQHNSAQ